MDWRKHLEGLGARISPASSADRAALAKTERALGLNLPNVLSDLLAATDGVRDQLGTDVVWPAAEINARNLEFRSMVEFRELYMPFDCVLFFGDAGNGDQFFYRVLANEVRDSDIYLWDHETDSRVWRAASLEAYLDQALRESRGKQ